MGRTIALEAIIDAFQEIDFILLYPVLSHLALFLQLSARLSASLAWTQAHEGMEPLSVLDIVEACSGLAVTAGRLAIGLKTLADNYRSAALTFRSLSNQCRLFATAVRAVQAWMEDAPNTLSIDDSIW